MKDEQTQNVALKTSKMSFFVFFRFAVHKEMSEIAKILTLEKLE